MALPFLPADTIADAFNRLRAQHHQPELDPLLDYVEHQWINGPVFSPDEWSVFNQVVRTNNDTEGWHRRFNFYASRSNLQLYILIEQLFLESSYVQLQADLVSDNKLKRTSTKRSDNLQSRILSLVKTYADSDQTDADVDRLLDAASFLNGPNISAEPDVPQL